jgi:cobalt/nickel transport system permease protein
MIPEWMRDVDTSPCRCDAVSGGRKSFIQKTLDTIFAFLQETFDTEKLSKKNGLLQSLDPRVKMISILTLIFALSITGDVRILAAVYILEMLLCAASLIGIGFFIKRVWLFVPLFTLVIAIPMLFNVFLPGDPLYQVAYLGENASLGPIALPESIYITTQGTNAAVVFTLRVVVSVSAVVLLFLTTPQAVLFKSLRSIGVPKLYVLTLEMAYRYIFLLTDLIREVYIAKRARTIRSRSMREEQKWVGGRIGYILIRSLGMSEKVHMAMVSRGFNGDVKIMQDFQLRTADYLFGLSAFTISLILVLISQNAIRI